MGVLAATAEVAEEKMEDKVDRRRGPRSGPGRPSQEKRESILAKVKAATDRREAAKTEMAEAETQFRQEIRNAFAQGVTVGPIMQATGLSETRTYQVRDGKRL